MELFAPEDCLLFLTEKTTKHSLCLSGWNSHYNGLEKRKKEKKKKEKTERELGGGGAQQRKNPLKKSRAEETESDTRHIK